jgi:hypothetical protein
LDAIPALRRAEVLDSQLAADRDFLPATAGRERLVLWPRQRVLKRPREHRRRVAKRKAVSQSTLRAARVLRVAPLHVLPALPRAQTDESELPPAQSLRAQLASPLAPPQVREPAPYVPLERRPRVLPARSALPYVQRELPVRPVSRRLASRSVAELRREQRV